MSELDEGLGRVINAMKYIEGLELHYTENISLQALVIATVYLQNKYGDISELKLKDVINNFVMENARHSKQG